MTLTVVVYGRGGQGILTASEILAAMLKEMGYEISGYSKPSHTQRGGETFAVLRVFGNNCKRRERYAILLSEAEKHILEGYKKIKINREDQNANLYAIGVFLGNFLNGEDSQKIYRIAEKVLKESRLAKYFERAYRALLEGLKDGKESYERL